MKVVFLKGIYFSSFYQQIKFLHTVCHRLLVIILNVEGIDQAKVRNRSPLLQPSLDREY